MIKPWRVISNDDGVDEDFATLDEAVKEAEIVLGLWRQQAHDEGEWDEDVEGVEIHLVTHAARITMRDGDNEFDGVEYGITEILGNEIDEELRQLRAQNAELLEALEEVSSNEARLFLASESNRIATDALAKAKGYMPGSSKCEWLELPPVIDEWHSPGCGDGAAFSCVEFNFCPYCGKPITKAKG